MIVEEMRTSVGLAVGSSDFTASDIDRAFRAAGNELLRAADLIRVERSVALTAFSNEVDLSAVTGFRPERIKLAEIGYNDRGEWATATSYALNDLVQGDGDPDSRLYVCKVAHTSAAATEPPDAATWVRVLNKRGTPLKIRPYNQVIDPPVELMRGPGFHRHPFGRAAYGYNVPGMPSTGSIGQYATGDRPTLIGFANPTTGYVWPTPEAAYPLVLTLRDVLTTWTPGATDAPTLATEINIPDEYMDPVVQMGAPAILAYPDPTDRSSDLRYQQFQAEVRRIKGEVQPYATVQQRRPNGNGA